MSVSGTSFLILEAPKIGLYEVKLKASFDEKPLLPHQEISISVDVVEGGAGSEDPIEEELE